MKKSIKILLTAVIAVSMCAAVAGCGEADDKGKTAPTSAVSTEQSSTVSDTESSEEISEDEEISEEESDENEEFAGTTKEKASALALSEAGKSFRVIYTAQKNIDDEDMWKIVLADESNSMIVAYVKNEECSFDTIEERVFAGCTESGAVLMALSNAGDGVWTAETTTMITNPNKKELWQVTLKSDSGLFKILYISGSDCFKSLDSAENAE